MLTIKQKIKKFQKALGTREDGYAGQHTWDSALRFLKHEGYTNISMPYAGKFFGCYTITGNPDTLQLKATKGKYGVGSFPFSLSGSFTVVERSGQRMPVSIMVNDGKVIRNDSCHVYDMGTPETVLYWTYDGLMGTKLCKHASELPKGVKWAVGGMSLITNGKASMKASVEGFTGQFSDVLRKTYHTCIGFDRYGNIIGVYGYGNAKTMQSKCISLGLTDAIMLDGGHLAAINTDAYKRNTKQAQGYLIQWG